VCRFPALCLVFQDKENAPQTGRKLRKLRRAEDNTSKACEPPELHPQCQPTVRCQESVPVGASVSKCGYHTDRSAPGAVVTRLVDQSFVAEGVIPSPHQADGYFLGHQPDPNKLDKVYRSDSSGAGSSFENTLVELNPLEATLTRVDKVTQGSHHSHQHSDPPPLPPKPKHLPVKVSVWEAGANISGSANSSTYRSTADGACARFVRPAEVKRDVRVCRSRRAVYLDQPSSSFV
jgi:hypothetical protein